MRKLGAVFVFVFLAVAASGNAQQFPDPTILVNTPSGTTVSVPLPPTPAPGQSYTPTAQPVVVPVPITFQVTPNIIQQRPAPVAVRQPAPAFPPQPPQPSNSACAPLNPNVPVEPPTVPPEPMMDGPIRSTVLPPPGYVPPGTPPGSFQPPSIFRPDPSQGPLAQQTVPAPYPPGLYAPRQGVYFAPEAPAMAAPAPTSPLAVPPPGIPYSLDAQGRPQYVQQPGSVLPDPNQWPGYTPAGYAPPVAPYPGYAQQQQFQQQPQQYDQQFQQYQQYQRQVQQQQQGYQNPANFYNNLIEANAVPPGLSPSANPNLTNPNTAVQLVTPAQVNQAIREGTQMVILDVRGELVRDVIGHIPNDVHVSLTPTETFPARVRHSIPDQRFPVVVYCNDGINSSRAANMMANMGYKVYLMGIYTGWAGHIPAQACTSCIYQ